MRWMIVAGLFAYASVSYGDFQKANLVPIELSAYQQDSISKDLPLQGVTISKNQHIIAVGQKYLWQFDPRTTHLSKIDLGLSSNEPIMAWVLGTDEVFVATRTHLISYDPSSHERNEFRSLTKKVSDIPNLQRDETLRQNTGENVQHEFNPEISNDNERGFNTLTLAPHPSGCLWFANSHIYFANRLDKTLSPLGENQYVQDHDLVRANHSVWVARGPYLLNFDLAAPDGNIRVVQKTYSRISDLIINEKSMFVVTPETVLKLSTQGRLAQAIPAAGKRQVVAADFTEEQHTYLLSDGTLEFYHLTSKASAFAKISDFSTDKPPKQLASRGMLVALAGEPGLFIFGISELLSMKSSAPKL